MAATDWRADLVVIVDGANVVGARPDGWWRDRAGAARRLRGELAQLAARGVERIPVDTGFPQRDRWFPDIVLVVEGAARRIASDQQPDDPNGPLTASGNPEGQGQGDGPSGHGVRVVAASGSGDDTIVEVVRSTPGRPLVVTADRQLKERCRAAGAAVVGPRWLLDQL